MGISAPRANNFEIIALQKITRLIGINPMSLNEPWYESIDIIVLKPVKKY